MSIHRALAAAALATLLANPRPAAPQDDKPPTLPPVVVESGRVLPDRTRTLEEAREEIERTPGAVDVVGEEAIRQSRGANLKDALEFVPGVLVRPRFGAADESQFSIRGSGLQNNFHLRGVNVLLDGFYYGNADGFSDFESLELLTTKRIEVYRGANAWRFGGNTIGGAVNLVTKTGYDVPRVDLWGEAGSFGFFKGYLGTGGVFGPLDLYAAFTDTELDGYRDWSDQTRRRVYATAGYSLGGGASIRYDFGYVYNRELLPGSLTRPEFDQDPRQADPANVRQKAARNYEYYRGAVTLWVPLAEGQAVEAKVQLNYQDMDNPLAFAIIDDVTTNWGAELRYVLSRPILGLPNRLTAGAQYFGERQIDVNLANNQGTRGAVTKDNLNRADLFAAYLEDQLTVLPALDLVLGGRVDYSPRTVDNELTGTSQYVDYLGLLPRVGFVWRIAPAVQVYGNVSKAFQPPLLLEATAPGNVGAPIDALKAEKAWQFEIGSRGSWRDRLTWDVAVYDYELRDEIQNVNVRPFPGAPFTIPRFQNIPGSRHTGVEFGIGGLLIRDILPRLGLGTTGDTLRLRGAYTFSRFVFTDDPTFEGNTIPGAPAHFIVAELRYDHGSGFYVAPRTEAAPKGYFVDSASTVRTPAYALLSVRAGYDYQPWKLGVYFEARNLTDVNYVSSVVVDSATARFFEPGDGRAFYGGMSWSW
jgi:iron complex outermembrane receptor protein